MNEKKLIIERSRKLPMSRCLVNDDWKESSLASVVITRRHVNGNITFGMFMADLLCLGVKDTFGRFNVPENEIMDKLDEHSLEFIEIPYVLAHNIVYGGLDYAEELGIEPHKDFQYMQYVLEEDTEDIELIEIECGKDGKPMLMGEYSPKLMQHKAHLERTLGKDNFTFVLDDPDDDFSEEDDYDDDIDEDEEDEFDEEYESPFSAGSGLPSEADLEYMEKKVNKGFIFDKDLDDLSIRFNDWLFDDDVFCNDDKLEDDYLTILAEHDISDEVFDFYEELHKYTIEGSLEIIDEKIRDYPEMPLYYALYADYLHERNDDKTDEYILSALKKFPGSFLLSAQYLYQLHETGRFDEFEVFCANRFSVYDYNPETEIGDDFLEKFYIVIAEYFLRKKDMNRGLQYLLPVIGESKPDLLYSAYLNAIKQKML